jgi:hypothetical protein
MPSLLALFAAGAFALEPPPPPVETPSNGVVGSVIGGLPSAAPVGSLPDEGVERGAPSLTAALGEAAHVVLAEVVDTHDVAGTPVEEAEVRLVLRGDPGVARVFYTVSSCGCGEPEKAKPGTPVLLLLAPGADVQQTRRFWQALDRIAKPSDFFDVVWSGSGRLVADADGLVETWLSLPASVPARRVGESSGRLAGKRVALDALVAWIQERAAEAEQPLP